MFKAFFDGTFIGFCGGFDDEKEVINSIIKSRHVPKHLVSFITAARI